VADAITSQVIADLLRREAQEVAVALAVHADLMTRRHDLGGERRAAGDLLAGEEEGRPRVRVAQQLEHRRRSLGVGAVIERERRAAGGVHPVAHPEQRAQSGEAPGERRRPVQGRPSHREREHAAILPRSQ
jgi:hypothetical protein